MNSLQTLDNELAASIKEVLQNNNAIIEKLTFQISEMKPKAEIHDILMSSDSLKEWAAVAKTLNFKNMGRNNLCEYLRKKDVLRYNNEPYQRYVNLGYFKVIEELYGGNKTYSKTMTTQKGIDYIAKLLLGDGYEPNIATERQDSGNQEGTGRIKSLFENECSEGH